MTTDELITQQNFVNALTNGINIKPQSEGELYSFGSRLINWINDTDNVYWAAWDPKYRTRIILDMNNAELMHLQLKPGKLEFRRNEPGIEHRLEKEFGNGAVGVMLFCMIDNGDIEELDVRVAPEVKPAKPTGKNKSTQKPNFDFL